MIYNDALNNTHSWEEIEKKISALSSEKERGDTFEYFCESYLQLIPEYRIKNVWLRGRFPHRIIQRLHLIGQKDQGIDLIAETDDGKIWAIQAKFRSDRKNAVSYKELSTFLAISDMADYRLLISNTENLPSVVEKRKSFGEVLVDRLDGLDQSFFKIFKTYLKSKKQPKIKPLIPKPHQKKAIKAAVIHFKSSSRGQLIMACGTGKTLASVWIAEALKAKNILVMVPSLALMRQTISVWAKNYKVFPFNYLCVCSDESVAHDVRSDYAIGHLWEMDVPVTTNARSARRFISVHKNKPIIIFSTYQSSPVVSEAILKVPGYKFDLTICDEAHRTAGLSKSIFNLVLSDEHIPAAKRLFMTATPRILAKHVIKRGVEEDIEMFSMADEKKYGKEFSRLSFGEAIKRKLLTDYKVVIAIVTDKEMASIISHRGRVQIESKTIRERDVKALAKQVAFLKAVKDYHIHHAISYHSRVAFAKDFADPENDCSIISVNDLFKRCSQKALTIDAFHVNGTMSSAERSTILRDFTESDYSVVSNARCLTEGVDIPAVDGVLFFDPKYRLTDIVQATGRAIRLHKGKRYGYIIVPVFVEKGEDIETALESSDFDQVWSVIKAMQSQDERLDEVISRIRTLDGQIQGGNKEVASKRQSLEEHLFERIKILDIPRKISARTFIRKIETKLLDNIGYSWDFMYGVLAAFKNKYPYRWPKAIETFRAYRIGNWCTNQRQLFSDSKLSTNKVKRLDKIGFIWAPHVDAWECAFDLLKEFRKKNPRRWPEAGIVYKELKLGNWCSIQRQLKKRNLLSKDRMNKLDKIGFPWDPRHMSWNHGFELLKKFRVRNENRWPRKNEIYNGFELGNWFLKQRYSQIRGLLSVARFNKLYTLKFPWSKTREDIWDKKFRALKSFVEKASRFPIARERVKGCDLGSWCQQQRQKKQSLSKIRISKLNSISFVWDPIDTEWNYFYNLLKEFKQKFKRWPDKNEVYKNCILRSWMRTQQINKSNNKLPLNKMKKLIRVGFPWDFRTQGTRARKWDNNYNLLKEFLDKNFSNKLIHSLVYKKIKLGYWFYNQIQRKNLLDSLKIKKLQQLNVSLDPHHDSVWEGKYKALKEFVSKKSRWPRGREKYNNVDLGGWCHFQRWLKRNGNLRFKRIKKLNAIKFPWTLDRK